MAFIDRTGQKVGSLTVVVDSFSEQLHCKCDCGREGMYPRGIFKPSYRGPKSCAYCLGSPCEICGEIIPNKGRRMAKTCSEKCYTERHRQQGLDYYYNNKDSEHWKSTREQYIQAQKAKLEANPELYIQFRESQRERLRKSRSKINKDPVKREQYLSSHRERQRLFLIEIKKDPDRYQQYLERCRRWYHSLSREDYERIFLIPAQERRKKRTNKKPAL